MKRIVFEEILEYVGEKLYEADEDPQLTEAQIAVLKAGWENLNYDKMSEYYPYKPAYLRFVASSLWQKLSILFGEEIGKRTFRRQPPITYKFYGRQEEIKLINKLPENTKCISISGAKGIGKTSLAAKIFKDHQLKNVFKSLIWHHAYSNIISEDIGDLLYSVYGKSYDNPEKKLYQELQKERKLIVFDGIDCWDNKEEIDTFLKRLVEVNHNSLIILTSKISLDVLEELELNKRAVLNILLQGLEAADVERIMINYGLESDNEEGFVNSFKGNPYLVHRACERVNELFGGNVDEFSSKTSYAKIQFEPEFDSLLKSPKVGQVEIFILSYLASIEEKLPIQFKILVNEIEKKSSFSNSIIEDSLKTLKSLSLISFISDENKILVSVPRYFINYINTSNIVLTKSKKVS